MESIIGQKCLVFFSSRRFHISMVPKQRLVFGNFGLFLQNNQPTLDQKLKNGRLKDCKNYQENVSPSLAKRKLAEKNY